MANATQPHPTPPPAPGSEHSGAPKTGKQTRQERVKAEAEARKKADEEALKRATGGYIKEDPELKEKVLAMGGDVTRASPSPEQPLPDAEPGFTTTTGVPKTPMDPTTAAVPAEEDSDLVARMRGTPAIKADEHKS